MAVGGEIVKSPDLFPESGIVGLPGHVTLRVSGQNPRVKQWLRRTNHTVPHMHTQQFNTTLFLFTFRYP